VIPEAPDAESEPYTPASVALSEEDKAVVAPPVKAKVAKQTTIKEDIAKKAEVAPPVKVMVAK